MTREYGVRWEDGDRQMYLTAKSERHAERWSRRFAVAEVVSREVGDWHPVDEEQK